MIPAGFQIRGLAVTGTGLPPATLRFRPGLNVVTGESNSGKSFILQCLDFMLGAEKAPKPIPESRGYSRVDLEIETYDGTTFTLRRALAGGNFLLYRTGMDDVTGEGRPLSVQHVAGNENTVAAFLSGLCGFPTARLRTNKRNETVNLTWRTLIHLFLFDETRIITSQSPAHTSRAFSDTLMVSVVRFLLTGLDDSELVPSVDPKITRAQRTARREVYLELISTFSKELERFEPVIREAETTGLEGRSSALEAALQETSGRLGAILDRRDTLVRERRLTGDRLHDTRLSLRRFALLQTHYESDLERLAFLDEGQHYFEQLEPARCPTCLLPLTGDHDHGAPIFAVPEYAVAVAEESRKISDLLAELKATISSLQTREVDLTSRFTEIQRVLSEVDIEITAERPRFQDASREMKLLVAARHARQEWERIWRQRAVYSTYVDELGETVKPARATPVETLDGITLQAFSEVLEETLATWSYSREGRVVFDARTLDFTVGGVARASNGKGHRAVLNSAFAMSLLRYCDRHARPHPGFVVMDSPLTTFREDMSGRFEELGRVAERFFADLASVPPTHQVIIFENKEVPENLRAAMNYVEFSRERSGIRRGFFTP